MENTDFSKPNKKSKSSTKTLWQSGEVQPYDLGKPYKPIPKPILVSPKQKDKHKIDPTTFGLYQGDSLVQMSSWKDNYFDACITDPPYNIAKRGKGLTWAFSSHVTINQKWDKFTDAEYEKFTLNWLQEVCRITKENGNIFIFGSYHNIFTIGALAKKMDLRVINSIIWIKPNAQPNITCRMFTESTEQILWLCNNSNKKATRWTFNYQHMKSLNSNKQMRNYWEIPITPQREKCFGKHPSQKPIRLMERLVLAGTNSKDTVLDCFAGSGSTLIALDRLERNWVGIEQSPEYCLLAHQRLSNERKQRRLFKKLV